ncbi:cuticle protein 16.8, partial [Trichonephila inaurata madagascariensis]
LAAILAPFPKAPAYGAPAYGYEEKYAPQPFDFGYETNDNYGTTTFRKENGDGHGRVQGSYGYK